MPDNLNIGYINNYNERTGIFVASCMLDCIGRWWAQKKNEKASSGGEGQVRGTGEGREEEVECAGRKADHRNTCPILTERMIY